MNITEKNEESITQVFLEGRFDSNTCGIVEQFIREKIDGGSQDFVLNMEKVPFIASAGLRVVLVFAKELRNEHSGDLRLSSLQPNVRKVFEISGLNNVLKIYDDTGEATRSFSEEN